MVVVRNTQTLKQTTKQKGNNMKIEMTIPVIMFDEDNIDIRKILDLLEKELSELTELHVTLNWKCLQLI